MARDIQTGFLPSALPNIPGYELAFWRQPADAVGGDYYDLVTLPDGRLGLVITDVSGHGFAASLMIASVRAMLHVLARTASDRATILSLLTESIVGEVHDGRFITFLIVALDPSAHELTSANAGHRPAFHFRREGHDFRDLDRTGLPIGFSEDFKFSLGPVLKMEPGDLLVLGTDGVIETRNRQGKIFGGNRLKRLICKHCHFPAPQRLELVKTTVKNFNPEVDPLDDITLLILERKLS